MDCWEISSLLANIIPETKRDFRKCISDNNLSEIKNLILYGKHNIFIVLLNGHKQIGHFCLIFFSKDQTLVIFDSPGVTDDHPLLRNIPQLNPEKIYFNNTSFQGKDMCVCGLYCLYVALWLSLGKFFGKCFPDFPPQIIDGMTITFSNGLSITLSI